MPRSAIATGAVDLVLPVAKIPDALITYDRRMILTRKQNGSRAKDSAPEWLPEIIELLRTKTGHDFRLYKSGTLQRRIERRMAMAAIETDGMERYLEALRSNPDELDLLASDLLINVTSFFRDRPGIRSPGGEDRSRSRPAPIIRPAAAHLDRRVQHRRGDLLARHAVPRSNQCGKEQRQASGLRLRYRFGCGRQRSRGLLSGRHRGRGFAGPPRPLLFEGRSRLQGIAGTARDAWSSRSRMFWPIHRSPAWTWFRAAIS